MAIKFYTDEHVHPAIINALRKGGIDVLTAQQAGMLGIDDKEHLKFASSQDRILFTQDDDFLRLHGKIKHAGIVYAHQKTPMRQIIQGLTLIYQVLRKDDMKNHVEFL